MTTTFPPSSAPPTVSASSPLTWLRKNLFNSWFNSILTIVILLLLVRTALGVFIWATTAAQWEVISANLPLYFVGRYPSDQYWRLWVILGMIGTLAGTSWGVIARNVPVLFSRNVLIIISLVTLLAVVMPTPLSYRLLMLAMEAIVLLSAWIGQKMGRQVPVLGQWLSLSWFVAFLVGFWLLSGGLGLEEVSTNNWGGLLLTVFIAVVSIVLCFPIGVLLALGRQSSLPVLRWLSIIYIELVRGVPLIAILFIGQNMIPLFLPQGIRPENIYRAIIGLTVFSSAYLAENVRGGLQAIPRGQVEAAGALGLNPLLVTGLIVLPQALKISIPAIVGQFISLFQDTTLLSIVSVVELLGISRAVLANPNFIGRYWEVYLFIGVIYWFFCYSMSLGSRRLEQSLNTGQR